MTTKDEEEKMLLEVKADSILREAGFDSRGEPLPGKVGEERRRAAAIRLGKHPEHFEDSPRTKSSSE